MQTKFTEYRNKSQACSKNSEFAIMGFQCNKSLEKKTRRIIKKQIGCSSTLKCNFMQKKFLKKEIKGTKFFNYKKHLDKTTQLVKKDGYQQQTNFKQNKNCNIDIFNSLTKNCQRNNQIFFKSKREAKFFDLFIDQNSKLKIKRRMSSRWCPKQDEDDFDTDEEILAKSVEKIIGLLQREIQKRNSNFQIQLIFYFQSNIYDCI